MSERMACPSCNAYLSSVLNAFAAREPCPNCGLPADAALELLAARSRGADKELVTRHAEMSIQLAAAVARAEKAERRLENVRCALEGEE